MKTYRILVALDVIQNITILLTVGCMFNIIWFIIIGSIMTIVLSNYSYHFHCNNLDNCSLMTSMLFLCFGLISNQAPYWVGLILFVVSIKTIYEKMPLKKVKEEKTEEWHNKRLLLCIVMFFILAMASYYFGLVFISSNIIWGIVVYGFTFIKNEKKYI